MQTIWARTALGQQLNGTRAARGQAATGGKTEGPHGALTDAKPTHDQQDRAKRVQACIDRGQVEDPPRLGEPSRSGDQFVDRGRIIRFEEPDDPAAVDQGEPITVGE